MGWKGALTGGVVGYVTGLFFKSALPALITFKFPSASQYLTDTFVPSSAVDAIRFITIPVPFALLGAALGVLYLRGKTGAGTTGSLGEPFDNK